MYIRNPGHMTKMAAMPIYGKNPSKIFSRTGGPISTKLACMRGSRGGGGGGGGDRTPLEFENFT